MSTNKAPEKIYLPWEYSEINVLPPGVTTKQIFGKDVCFIRKDALLEWLEQEIAQRQQWLDRYGEGEDLHAVVELKKVIDKLNSL